MSVVSRDVPPAGQVAVAPAPEGTPGAAAPLSLDRMRLGVAEQLGEPAERVGYDDDLLQLGLDSIGLMRLAGHWRRAGAEVTFAELIEYRTLREWWALIESRTGRPVTGPDPEPEIDEAAPFPLALMQHAYWIGRADGQVLGGVGAHFYNEFDGRDVQPARLERAVRALIRRHGMLRARFHDDGHQQIGADGGWPGLAVHDLRTASPADADAALTALRDRLSHRRLDVARGEVFDIQLSLLPDGSTRVHVSIEMLVADALSFRILLTDLAALYHRPDAELPPIDYSYPRYLAARERQGDSARNEARAYWHDRLADLPGGPELPLATPPERVTNPHVVRRHHWLGPREWETLAGRARQHGITLSMVFLTAFAEVIAAWSARQRFLLNLPLYDRELVHPDVSRLVGDFTNLLLLDVDATVERPFVDRARQLQERFSQDVSHSAYSGVDVLRDLTRQHPDRSGGAPVVFTSALSLGELFGADVRECFGDPGWTMSQTPQVWLDHQVTEREGGLFLNWDAVSELFPDGVLDGMFAGYVTLLEALLDGDTAWTGPLPALVPRDQLAVRAAANGTVGQPSRTSLHERFFARAEREPDRVALCWGEDSVLSYGELASRALRLAGTLTANGVVAGDPVAVSLPKGPDQVVAVLGVLAAGGIYVPIGVDQPVVRRDRIVARSGAKVVVDPALLADASAARPLDALVRVDVETPAYVIFTSGSTGEPKGVEVPHRAAVNTIDDINARFAVGTGDRVLAVSALDFDLSVYDIFGLLSVGGGVVLIGEDERRDARRWVDLARRWDVTIWQSVPALLDMLLVAAGDTAAGDSAAGDSAAGDSAAGDTAAGDERLGGLRLVLLGGDWVGLDLRDRLTGVQPGCRLIALGGTTETAIHSSVCEVTEVPPHWRSVPYGRPLRNQVFRVVDGRGRDCPDWVAGELWIGGLSVALGYRGDPARTADRFVEHDGLRWYRSGDLGRYWPDGTVEFLGRADFQVKIRGHRIELGEIEAALETYPGVADAVVVADRQLAAAVTTGRSDVDETALRHHLADRLPGYMVPERIAVLERLPLSPNGKIDRRAVAGLIELSAGTRQSSPPEGEVETAIAALWSELLDAPAVGREDSFFALGGDSLLATRLIARMRAAGLHGAELGRLFATPALTDFAAGVRSGPPVAAPAELRADPAHRYEPFPPTDVQRAYWMGRTADFTLGSVGSHWYWEFDGADVDVARLERAWNRLVRRHEMLRAVFDPDGLQRILRDVPDTHIPVHDGDEAVARLRERLSHRVPDPTRWPLVAIEAVRYGDGRVRVAFSFDYIVLDALSIVTIFGELSTLYRDPDADLPPLGVSFRDYILGAQPDPDALAESQRYWQDRLTGLPPGPQLPLRTDPGRVTSPRFVRREARLTPVQWQALRDRARAHDVTPAAVLATAFAEVLAAWSGRQDLTLNLTLFDRREVHPDINRILGDFTSLLLVAHQPAPGDGWLDLVRRFQQQVWSGMQHSAVSAIWVLRELARRTGVPAVTMPVVFTSALGVSDELVNMALPFGEQVWGVSQTPQVWLDNQVMERGGGLSVNWDAVEELFPDGVLDGMFDAYLRLLERLVDGDSAWREPVPALVPAAQRTVREAANATTGPVSGATLHGRFFDRAAREPDRVALCWGDGSVLTYGTLAERALQLAGLLRDRGVDAGDPVAVSLPKGPDQVVAVLGVLAAGGVYVPIGVDQPVVRRDRIVELSGARLVIDAATVGTTAEPLPAPVPVDTGALAYVIFTSGSTGEPKGVEITHAAAVNTIDDVNERYAVGPEDRVLAVSALDFDLSVYDVFGLLAVGGAVVLIGEYERRDARRWAGLVRRFDVTVWNTVPALLDMLLVAAGDEGLGRLRLALVSGDWVGLDLRDRLTAARPGCRLIALGGATEAAIWSNAQEVTRVPAEWRSVPYGRPLRNQVFRVVDGRGRDCPDWVAGELWIGGHGVAAGYRGDPRRTAERFVEHAGLRWYRTGDLGRYWPDGTLEFLGREDFQVKIRGHRIELGEIEAALETHPGVADAVVVTIEGPARRLAAAVVAVDETDGLPAYLADRLPGYMIPERIEVVDRLPLSANGKVDRAALSGLLAGDQAQGTAEPPRDGVEREIADAWTDLLGLPVDDRDLSFFALGGDSLLATRLVATLRDRYGVDVPLRTLFDRPTVAELADVVAEQRKSVETGAFEEGVL